MQTSLTDRNGTTTGGEVLWQCSLRMRRANSCKGLQINISVEDSRTTTPRRRLSLDNIASIAAYRRGKHYRHHHHRRRLGHQPPDQPQPETFEDTNHVGCTPEWHDQSTMCPL